MRVTDGGGATGGLTASVPRASARRTGWLRSSPPPESPPPRDWHRQEDETGAGSRRRVGRQRRLPRRANGQECKNEKQMNRKRSDKGCPRDSAMGNQTSSASIRPLPIAAD